MADDPNATEDPIANDPGMEGLSGLAQYHDDDLVGKEQDINGDGTIMKIIKVSGSGPHKPTKASEVSLHYKLMLEDGTEADNTRDRGEPFEFKVGEGEVIKGLDMLVATMREGEQCSALVAPQYGYGEEGHGAIPPNSRLKFEVELMGWREYKDISEDKVLEEKKEMKFVYGVSELPYGLEVALEKMTKGESSYLQLAPHHAFGPNGNPDLGVPPDTVVVYDITLHDVKNPQPKWALNPQERYEFALKMKEEGNAHLKEGIKDLKDQPIKAAVRKYKLALVYLEENTAEDTVEGDALGLQVSLHLNIAAVAIRTGTWGAVIKEADRALALQPNNTKALLRKGKAYAELREHDLARDLFAAVVNTEGAPEAAEAKKELAKVTKKIRAIEDKERQSYKKMFASAPKDVPKDAKAPEAPAEASNGGAAEAREGQPRAKAPEGAPRDARAEAAQEKARYGGMFDRVNLSADVESGPAAPKWTDAEELPPDMSKEEAYKALIELQREQKRLKEQLRYAKRKEAEEENKITEVPDDWKPDPLWTPPKNP